MKNKILLYYKKPIKHTLLNLVIIIVLIAIILYSYITKTYDSINIIGIYKCEDYCYIDSTISYDLITKLSDNIIIDYNNKTYQINEIIYSEPYLNNNVAYEDIKIISNLNIKEKIIKVKLLYNKQRIITKIKNYILGED